MSSTNLIVSVLVTGTKHGDAVYVYLTEEGAEEGAREFVRECLAVDVLPDGLMDDPHAFPEWDVRDSWGIERVEVMP